MWNMWYRSDLLEQFPHRRSRRRWRLLQMLYQSIPTCCRRVWRDTVKLLSSPLLLWGDNGVLAIMATARQANLVRPQILLLHQDPDPHQSRKRDRIFRSSTPLICFDTTFCSICVWPYSYLPTPSIPLSITLLRWLKVCDGCKSRVNMEKHLKVEQPPEVLVIQLNRFENLGSYTSKIQEMVKYQLELDLKPFLCGYCEFHFLLILSYSPRTHLYG
ncbi:uncharacterized protein LOC124673070 [Lolium rigidum]|uniref:uncharacterized protein LOC124673070 n=1 Tax=Lolium rigidum TaxID=89674 RepID=UPI001F5DCC7A|nr:uncharacterized protein LOC124673070 [Lolium rigidum]